MHVEVGFEASTSRNERFASCHFDKNDQTDKWAKFHQPSSNQHPGNVMVIPIASELTMGDVAVLVCTDMAFMEDKDRFCAGAGNHIKLANFLYTM